MLFWNNYASYYKYTGNGLQKMLNGLIIGVVQGVLEWLPVSSEGAVWLIINQLEDMSFETGVKYALFVHLATVPSAILVFRKQILYMINSLARRPSEPDAVIVFLMTSFVVSGFVGLTIMKAVEFVSPLIGPLGMLLVGILLIATGGMSFFKAQYFRHVFSKPSQIYKIPLYEEDFSETASKSTGFKYISSIPKRVLLDSLILGLAQGLAVLPGLSRSGITISLLLYRGVEKNNAVTMSFLMSIPASLAAALYAIFTTENLSFSTPILVSCLTAFIVGTIFIKVVLKFVSKINLTFFIVATAVVVICGALLDILDR